MKQAKCLKEGGNVKFVRKADPYAKVPKYADYTKACGTDGTKATPLFFIGVDANQNYLGDTDNNPNTLNHGLTSMMKRVDVATYEVIKSVVQKAFKGGVREFGLANNGVGYALDQYNKALIPASVVSKLEVLKQQIIKGQIKVPESR